MATASSSLALALLFASFLSSMVCGESTIPMLERFQAWQATYNRTYAALDEFQRRFEVYSENLEFIEATNLLERPYELGENQFADLTYEEFQDTYLMKLDEEASALDPTPEAMGQLDNTMNAVEAPNSVDWRTKGAVTPVKDQKQCGSCWAFAAVASIEGVHKIRTGRLVSLSEQEIVDCDRGGDDHGCQGGYPSSAMAWVARNRGLTAESDYPYTGRQGRQCRRGKLGHHAATIRGARAVPRNNEAALERAVAGSRSPCSSTRAARSSSTGAGCSRAPAAPASTTPSRWLGTAAPAAAGTGPSRTRGAGRGGRMGTCGCRGASGPGRACAASPWRRTTR
ncbi:unnamed protein product [Urochloa humidicola]